MYSVHNSTMTAPGFLESFNTIKETRKHIALLVREAKKEAGRSSFVHRSNKLHASCRIGTMKRGDRLELTIGKQGYHTWNAWSIK